MSLLIVWRELKIASNELLDQATLPLFFKNKQQSGTIEPVAAFWHQQDLREFALHGQNTRKETNI